jgi:hypothetical protein
MGVYYEKGDWVICTLQVVYNEPGPKFSFSHNFILRLLAPPVSSLLRERLMERTFWGTLITLNCELFNFGSSWNISYFNCCWFEL